MLSFVRANFRPLAFGALHAFYSSPGQTFVIGLFVASFADSFGLAPATVGGVYLIATVCAAATLLVLGPWIDHMRLVHYSAAVVVGLALACFAIALAGNAAMLLVALWLVRLTGQGLMTHVEATATGRMFAAERGRALAVTSLGTPAGELLFPPLTVAAIAAVGWRGTYAAFAIIALVVVLPLTQYLLFGIARSPKPAPSGQSPWQVLASGLTTLVRSRYARWTLPALMLMPFAGTAIYFHITTIAMERGWPLTLVAIAFPCAAVTSVFGILASGYIIDAFSARRLLLFQSFPLIVGLLILAAFEAEWALPAGFSCVGLTAGLARTTATAVWAETFGVDRLGAIRSASVMFIVLSTAAAPFLFGAGLSLGLGVSEAIGLFAAYGLAVVGPPFIAEVRGYR